MAIASGHDTRLILPDPDDIVIDDDTGYHLVGTFDEESLSKVEETVRYRDALLMQDVLDERLADRSPAQTRGRTQDRQSGALLFAFALNVTLPVRFRLDDITIIHRQMRYKRTNIRQLLKQTYAAWSAASVPARRGARFADLGRSRRTIGFMLDLHRAVAERRIDIDAFARGDFNDDAMDIIDRHGMTAN